MTEPTIQLRSGSIEDAELLVALEENDPEPNWIEVSDELTTFFNKVAARGQELLIILHKGIPVGWVLGEHQADNTVAIACYITPHKRGQGIGSTAIVQAKHQWNDRTLWGTIAAGNHASVAMAVKAGWSPKGQQDDGLPVWSDTR